MDLEKLKAANNRLKLSYSGVQIEQRGNRLGLQATFPPKPYSPYREPYQQKISLGLFANAEGLRQAEAKAKEISGLLAQKRFDWEPYLKSHIQIKEKTINDWIESFKQDYFSMRAENPKSLTTWEIDYLKPFLRLPSDQLLSEETLKKVLLETMPDTRTRRRYVLAFAKLADFVGLDHNLRKYLGNYSPGRANPRDLPNDKLIARIRNSIKNPQWQLAYGLQACYGLRNHEIFALDLSDFPLVYVEKGKTNERYVYPLFPEWADLWELNKGKLPICTGKANKDLGNRVTVAYKRFDVPFSPYALRHCWAVRSLTFGLDLSLAAAQMGHSVRVHSEIYHHWISKDVHQSAMEIVLNNPNRPIPP